jgi:hypothetical protein
VAGRRVRARRDGMRSLLLAVLVLSALPGCNRGNRVAAANVPALVAAAVTGGGRVLLDPLSTRVLLGTILLQNTIAAGVLGGDIRVRVAPEPGVEPDETEVVLAPGEQRAIAVYTTLVTLAALQLTVFAKYVDGGSERAFPVQWSNELAAARSLAVLQLLAAPSIAPVWYQSAVLAAVGVLTRNSNPNVPQRVPALAQDVRVYGALLKFLTVLQLQAAFGGLDSSDGGPEGATFPPGAGAEGFTVAAAPGAPLTEGEYCVFWLSVQAAIPLAEPTQRFTYAFVADGDANPANNWVPAPAFPDDFFAGTDRWYELDYTPATGWALRCRAVGPGNTLTTVASAARAILAGDTLLLLVPRGEFALATPPFRASTFAHLGDFGQNPPFTWSGDPTPPVAEGLRAWQ